MSIEVGDGLLYPALRKAGVTLAPGRGPSPAQMQDSLDELNRLLGSLNCDPYWIYSHDILQFPLTGAASYTIGPSGGTWTAPRPQQITAANAVRGASKTPVRVYTPLAWSQGPDDAGIYDDMAAPLSTIYVHGLTGATALEMYVWHLVSEITAVTDQVSLPPGYPDAVVLNLACRLAPQFQRPLDPLVLQQARESLMRVESLNAPRPIADTSGGLSCGCGGGYNIYSDQ